ILPKTTLYFFCYLAMQEIAEVNDNNFALKKSNTGLTNLQTIDRPLTLFKKCDASSQLSELNYTHTPTPTPVHIPKNLFTDFEKVSGMSSKEIVENEIQSEQSKISTYKQAKNAKSSSNGTKVYQKENYQPDQNSKRGEMKSKKKNPTSKNLADYDQSSLGTPDKKFDHHHQLIIGSSRSGKSQRDPLRDCSTTILNSRSRSHFQSGMEHTRGRRSPSWTRNSGEKSSESENENGKGSRRRKSKDSGGGTGTGGGSTRETGTATWHHCETNSTTQKKKRIEKTNSYPSTTMILHNTQPTIGRQHKTLMHPESIANRIYYTKVKSNRPRATNRLWIIKFHRQSTQVAVVMMHSITTTQATGKRLSLKYPPT
ncbi:hypothetical protein RFI_32958, partial [Reticulomyxa filosa]